MTFMTRWGTKISIENRETLLENNINQILGEYENGMYDEPEEFPEMSREEVINYCIPGIYDMVNDGHGYTCYAKGIAKELKFLGGDYICDKIVEIAEECGILKD